MSQLFNFELMVDPELILWILVNIFFPVVAPFIILQAPKLIKKTKPHSKDIILKSVQDGQLFWLTVALCAVGAYEVIAYIRADSDPAPHWGAGIGLFLLFLLWIFSVVLGVLSALSLTDYDKAAPQKVRDKQGNLIGTHGVSVPDCASETEKTEGEPENVSEATPDKLMIKISVGFVLLASLSAIVAHAAAAGATQRAMLKHEFEWQLYTTCMMTHSPEGSCQQPKEVSQ